MNPCSYGNKPIYISGGVNAEGRQLGPCVICQRCGANAHGFTLSDVINKWNETHKIPHHLDFMSRI